jgi:hypothetical protein
MRTYFAPAVCLLLAAGTAFATEYPTFSMLPDGHGRLYVPVAIATRAPDATFALDEEAARAAERLGVILGRTVGTQSTLYNQMDDAEEPIGAVAAVRFHAMAAPERDIAIQAQIISTEEKFEYAFTFGQVVAEQFNRTLTQPDGTTIDRTVIVHKTVWYTAVDSSVGRPVYADLATCLAQRPLAEQLVAADPANKVFWSTCHYAKGWYGFFAKVHYVRDVGGGDEG